MAIVIAVANQKGGCGKTTVTANLGIGLAMEGKPVIPSFARNPLNISAPSMRNSIRIFRILRLKQKHQSLKKHSLQISLQLILQNPGTFKPVTVLRNREPLIHQLRRWKGFGKPLFIKRNLQITV